MFAKGDRGEDVCNGAFARKSLRDNVRKKMLARERSRGNVREKTFMKGDGVGNRINVRERTFVKGDRGENSLEEIFARGDILGRDSSSTGELHVVESVHWITLTPNTHG